MKKFLIVIVFLLLPILTNASTIPEGSTIKTADNPDVYIVKYNNGKQFRRLILNPKVFESYGHLKWENIITVSAAEMNSYKISNLVKVENDPKVLALAPNGDSGSKSWLNVAATDFVAVGGDWDSIYQINVVDASNYNIATDLTTRSHVQTFLTSNILPNIESTPTPTPVLSPTPTPIITPIPYVVDFCNNIIGSQTHIPAGMFRDENNCYQKPIEFPTPTPVPIKKATVKIGADAHTQIEAHATLTDSINTYSKSLSRNLNKYGTNYELSPSLIARIYRQKSSNINININTGFVENEPSVICTKSGNEFWSGNITSENKGVTVFPGSLDWPVIIKNYYDDYVSKNPDITDVPLLFEVSCVASDGSVSSDSLTVYISDSAPL